MPYYMNIINQLEAMINAASRGELNVVVDLTLERVNMASTVSRSAHGVFTFLQKTQAMVKQEMLELNQSIRRPAAGKKQLDQFSNNAAQPRALEETGSSPDASDTCMLKVSLPIIIKQEHLDQNRHTSSSVSQPQPILPSSINRDRISSNDAVQPKAQKVTSSSQNASDTCHVKVSLPIMLKQEHLDQTSGSISQLCQPPTISNSLLQQLRGSINRDRTSVAIIAGDPANNRRIDRPIILPTVLGTVDIQKLHLSMENMIDGIKFSAAFNPSVQLVRLHISASIHCPSRPSLTSDKCNATEETQARATSNQVYDTRLSKLLPLAPPPEPLEQEVFASLTSSAALHQPLDSANKRFQRKRTASSNQVSSSSPQPPAKRSRRRNGNSSQPCQSPWQLGSCVQKDDGNRRYRKIDCLSKCHTLSRACPSASLNLLTSQTLMRWRRNFGFYKGNSH